MVCVQFQCNISNAHVIPTVDLFSFSYEAQTSETTLVSATYMDGLRFNDLFNSILVISG